MLGSNQKKGNTCYLGRTFCLLSTSHHLCWLQIFCKSTTCLSLLTWSSFPSASIAASSQSADGHNVVVKAEPRGITEPLANWGCSRGSKEGTIWFLKVLDWQKDQAGSLRSELAQESEDWLEKNLGWEEALLSVWRKRMGSYTHTIVFCFCCFSILCFILLEGGCLLSFSPPPLHSQFSSLTLAGEPAVAVL